MARFSKAMPQQARLKLSVYGPPGSGKTFSTLLMAEGLARIRKKKIAFVDTERGTDFYAQAVKERAVHPGKFEFDALYTRSLAEITDACRSMNPNEYGVIVIDSISHLWESAMDAYKGKKTRADTIPMNAWGSIKKPYKDLVAWLIGSPFDVFILGRQKNMFDNGDDGQMVKTGVGMRAEGDTAYEPHICLRMETKQNQDNSMVSDYWCLAEKDRTGVLSGRWYCNPSFATIEPLLPLLGETQAPAEDEDERIAKDAELMEETETKGRAKEAKSADLFQGLQRDLYSASTLPSLGTVYAAMMKSKRYMMEDHTNSLREIYKYKRNELVKAEAPDA